MTVKNYLKESLSSILSFIIQGKGSSWKRFDPELLIWCNIAHIWHNWVFFSSRTQWNRKGILPLIANMLFVSKNCSLKKVAFMNSSCFIICELNWIVNGHFWGCMSKHRKRYVNNFKQCACLYFNVCHPCHLNNCTKRSFPLNKFPVILPSYQSCKRFY